jgi:hypothetical protein
MWQDDIAEMVAVIRQAVPEGEIDIEVDGCKAEEVADLAQLDSPTVQALIVTDRAKKLTLELSTAQCLIKVDDPDLVTKGAVSEIIRIAGRCRRRYFAWVRAMALIYVGLVLAFGVFLVVAAAIGYSSFVDDFQTIEIVGIGVYLPLAAIVMFRPEVVSRESVLYARIRKDAPTFWMRKRDDLFLTAVASLISLILGGFLGYWINTIS